MARSKAKKNSQFQDSWDELSKALRKHDPAMSKRVTSEIIAGRLSVDDVIDQLASGQGSLFKNSLATLPSPQRREYEPAELVEILEEAAYHVGDEVPDAVWRKALRLDRSVDFELGESSFLKAIVKVGEQKKQTVTMRVDPDNYIVETGCSCKSAPCLHLAAFLQAVTSQCEDFQSPLAKMIYGEEEANRLHALNVQEMEEERKLSRDLLFRQLTKSVGPAEEPISLDEQKVASAERILWNLNVDPDAFSSSSQLALKPIIQKEKKAGGWGKGREVTLRTFLDMSRDCWTSLDWSIAGHFKDASWIYQPTADLDGVFCELEGSDLFCINRVPVQIEVRPFELAIIDENDGGWTIAAGHTALSVTLGKDAFGFTLEDGVLTYSLKRGRAFWTQIPHSLEDLADTIGESDLTFAADERDALISQLNALPSSIPLRLPESILSERKDVQVESVVLLRMKKTGTLEVTVAVRDDRKLLMLPGDGQIRRLETVDGELVQFVRDAVAERRAAAKLADQLSLDKFQPIRDSTWLVDEADDVISLLQKAGQLVEQQSLVLVWHKESAKQINVLGSLSAANVSVKVTKQRDWFGVNGSCKVGDKDVPLKDVLAGLRGASTMNGLIEVSPGQWASIADDFRATLQQLSDVSNESRGRLQLDQSAAMSLADIEEQALDIQADKAWKKCVEKVRSIRTINPDPPASLDCEFRDYQLDGFRWMCRLADWGVGGILADDMGLGKTVQTLAVLLQRMESGPALVIAPTSLGFNWESECHRFAPSLTPKLLRDGNRQELIENATEGDVIICSYGLVLRESELLQSVDWGTLVLDEAQNIKNSNTKTAKEVRKLSAGWKVALTGTPMENHLGELWSIFRAVSPGVLGSWEQFRKKFAAPIEKEQDNERRAALSQVISPFILRRSKKDVLTDLPERLESNLLIELTREEQERYDQVRLAAVGELDELGSEGLSSDQRFKVLQLLTRLRQISCHVGLIDDNWDHGSSKLRMLMERLEQLKERGHRALIFSQFTSHLGLIKEACDAAGFSYQYLDGQTTPKARQQRVELFQKGEGDVFLISLKAGGTGLNLTAADYVIHMDPWWNPAVEDQATDRAHRIGQQNNVMVYRIIAKGTIEEQIISLHAEKRDLVEGVLNGSEAAAKMSTEQLATLIREGVSAKV